MKPSAVGQPGGQLAPRCGRRATPRAARPGRPAGTAGSPSASACCTGRTRARGGRRRARPATAARRRGSRARRTGTSARRRCRSGTAAAHTPCDPSQPATIRQRSSRSSSVVPVPHDGPLGRQVVERHVGGGEHDLAAGGQARRDEVLDDLLLAVDGDRAAGQLEEVDAVARAVERQLDATVGEALAVEAVGEARAPAAARRSGARGRRRGRAARRSSRSRCSSTTQSMPRRASRWASTRPGRAGADDGDLRLVGGARAPMMARRRGQRRRESARRRRWAWRARAAHDRHDERRRRDEPEHEQDEQRTWPAARRTRRRRRLHRLQLHGRRAPVERRLPLRGRRRPRVPFDASTLAGERGAQLHRHVAGRASHPMPRARRRTACPPTAASRSASAKASNPPVSTRSPASVGRRVVAAVGDLARHDHFVNGGPEAVAAGSSPRRPTSPGG